MKEITAIRRPSRLLEVTEELHKTVTIRTNEGEGMRYDTRSSVDAPKGAQIVPESAAKAPSDKRRIEMRRCAPHASVILMFFLLSGCGAAAGTIAARSVSERSDIFREAAVNETPPAGYADVLITATIKTHLDGYHRGESRVSAHGKEVYPFLINIDGQAVLWQVAGKKHELPLYVDGITSRDPEAGRGMQYVLEKNIRIAAGTHRVFFGLPEEPYFTEADITVTSGGAYVLEFKPKYWHKGLPTHIPTFFKGINKYDVMLNGSAI